MMESMGDMMGAAMGARPSKEFYPALMDVPVLSLEARAEIERQARSRVALGGDAVTQAQADLHRAMEVSDAMALEHASQRLRDGLAMVDSGSAALRALAEGQAPRQIALTWFKEQMQLPVPKGERPAGGALGLSWFHLITMAIVSTFAVTMVLLSLARLRRASRLMRHLSGSAVTVSAVQQVQPQAVQTAPRSGDTVDMPAPEPLRVPTAAGPIVPLPAPGKAWSGKVRLAAIFHETPSVKTFRLVAPDGGPRPFDFMPGQFLTFSAEIGGKTVRRSYTIASSPTRRDYLEVTVKREENGVFSRHLHDTLAVGDLIEITAPSGSFTFTGEEADSVVLIGGGVGITPLMSAIRYLTDRAWVRDIFLLYCARTTEDFIFKEELEYLQRRYANLHIAATMTRAAGMSWMGPQGYITKTFITETVPEITRRRVHLCGPPAMMNATRALLDELGVPKAQVRTEAFGPAGPREAPVPSGHAAVSSGPASATIRFSRSGKAAPLPPDKSVLEVAESVGVEIDSSCRSGTCGTCKVRLREGSVTMEVEDGLAPGDKEAGFVLACQAKSVGNLVVDA
ncbi:MAG: FAD-binding oxidoreductase [Alphaproteobacteria bacterium]